MTSIAVRSTMMPWARNRLTWSIRSCRKRSVSESVSAACTVAMRIVPCFRMGTGMKARRICGGSPVLLAGAGDLVAQQAFGLLDPALQVAHSIHLRQVQPDGHQSQRDFRGQPG